MLQLCFLAARIYGSHVASVCQFRTIFSFSIQNLHRQLGDVPRDIISFPRIIERCRADIRDVTYAARARGDKLLVGGWRFPQTISPQPLALR